MRRVVPLIMGVAIAACTAAVPVQPAQLDARAQTRLAQLLNGKVAGPPESCLPNWQTRQMTVISDDLIVFQASPGRIWVQRPQNSCTLLAGGRYALVTRSSTGSLCRGDIAQVVDPLNHTTVGSCVIGDFMPYVRPGA